MPPKRRTISVVIIGHVDSGKSTTTGRLLVDTGALDKRTLEKLEKEAESMGKASFFLAYATDTTKQERQQGVTVDITARQIKTKNTDVTVVDAPGHADFLKNMITGTSQADYAVLVMPASSGEFATAISHKGSARQHAILANALGAAGMCVLVNKMDSVEYKKEVFEMCRDETLNMLRKVGFKKERVAVIPVSGMVGDNLTTHSKNMPWYTGTTFQSLSAKGDKTLETRNIVTVLDWFDSVNEPMRPIGNPLRVICESSFKVEGVGTVVAGRVESGVVKPGDNIWVAPVGLQSEVKSIEMHHEQLTSASPGLNIGMNVKNVGAKEIRRGYVIGHASNDPPMGAKSFVAQTIVVAATGAKDNGFKVGYSPVCDCHAAHIQVRVDKIVDKVDKHTNAALTDVSEEQLKQLKNGESGNVEYTPLKPVCVEAYKDYAPLGRAVMRDAKTTVAIAVIRSVVKEDASSKGKGGVKAKGAAAAAGKPAAAKAGGAKKK